MSVLNKILLITFIFFGTTQGSIFNSTNETKPNCKPITYDEASTCIPKIVDFTKKINEAQLSNSTLDIQYFVGSCEEVFECVHSVICVTNNFELVEYARKLKAACSFAKYYYSDFMPCVRKFEAMEPKSKCNLDYKPIEVTGNGMFASNEHICQTFFGKNNCAKMEIIEVCGESYWKGIRNALGAKNCLHFYL